MRHVLLLFVLMIGVALPAKGQDDDDAMTSRERMLYKDPGTARLMGLLLPGGGHFYSDETDTGLLIFGAGLGAPLVGFELTRTSEEQDCPEGATTPSDCQITRNYTPLYVGLAVGAAAWGLGILDADNAARRANERNGITARVHPIVGRQVGLAMRVTW